MSADRKALGTPPVFLYQLPGLSSPAICVTVSGSYNQRLQGGEFISNSNLVLHQRLVRGRWGERLRSAFGQLALSQQVQGGKEIVRHQDQPAASSLQRKRGAASHLRLSTEMGR